jgi:hypothetical protein
MALGPVESILGGILFGLIVGGEAIRFDIRRGKEQP